jgi:ribosomal protein S12 methylthiotransferase accessory factor YcaO
MQRFGESLRRFCLPICFNMRLLFTSTIMRTIVKVSNNGFALGFASARLRADYDVVMAAVQQYGMALYHASGALRSNREIAMAAVTENPSALEFASERLRTDQGFIVAAFTEAALR